MPAFQNPSETAKGKVEEFYLQLARGHIPNHSSIHKFGAVQEMSQNETGTVWDVDDVIYPWGDWDTAGTVTIPTVHASDDGKSIVIQGLDADYKYQEETLVVANGTPSVSQFSYIRLNRAFVLDGSVDNNVGVIDIQKNSNTIAKITAAKGQTLMAVYTIPANKTGYLIHGTATCQAGADATGDMFIRYGGQTSFRIGHSFEVSGTGGQYDYTFGVPLEIPEKTDIDVRASVRSNNARITAAFDIILIDM